MQTFVREAGVSAGQKWTGKEAQGRWGKVDGGCSEMKENGMKGKGRRGKTYDFDAVLGEIPTFEDGTMLALAHGGATEVVVQYDAPALMIAIATGGPALLYSVGDAHIGGRVKGRAAHDL